MVTTNNKRNNTNESWLVTQISLHMKRIYCHRVMIRTKQAVGLPKIKSLFRWTCGRERKRHFANNVQPQSRLRMVRERPALLCGKTPCGRCGLWRRVRGGVRGLAGVRACSARVTTLAGVLVWPGIRARSGHFGHIYCIRRGAFRLITHAAKQRTLCDRFDSVAV